MSDEEQMKRLDEAIQLIADAQCMMYLAVEKLQLLRDISSLREEADALADLIRFYWRRVRSERVRRASNA